ncbi:MAG: hypothetical protein RML93_03345 [Anaerolineales bacterium]|nr:hypothetical protein [Anaerolineales bacterium]MCS7247809.1 hypothetical protein [Anaerolineales bacterium]MDW8161619.1 hypothetical protein [Anaerolineales bacterium]MDW8446309.1 hypothetical protein [Anaerolineales bacterium]
MPLSFRPYLKRFAIVFLIAVVFVALFNEAMYLLQRDERDRPPKTIELVIPRGTAERIAQGKEVAIPEGMTFVVGDVLLVRNEDVVDHQLGPLWIPAGRSASLRFDTADKLAYQCSFVVGNYFGVDILKPTTWTSRLSALAMAAPTLAALLFVYSLVVLPLKPVEARRTAHPNGRG